MWLLLSIACGGPDGPRAGPTAWTFDAEPPGRVALAPEDLDQGFADLVAHLADINPVGAHTGHAWAMSHRDAGCPVMDEHNGQDLWWGDCETDAGTLFQGFSLYTRMFDFPVGDEWVHHYLWYHSHMVVEPASGGAYLALGDNEVRGVERRDGAREQSVYLLGDHRWTERVGDSTWLQEDLSVWLYMVASEFEDGHAFELNGGASRLPGTLAAVEIAHAELSEAPGACPLEPAGEMRVWEPSGGWYDVTFDGADASGAATDACDGCGTIWFDGAPVGPVCADFSPFLTWESGWKW